MDATRRLAVDLQNLSAKAKDTVILSTVPQTKAALDAAKTAALIATVDAAQKTVSRPRGR